MEEIRAEATFLLAGGGQNPPQDDDDKTHSTRGAAIKRLGLGVTVTKPRSVLFGFSGRVYAG